MRIEIEVPKAFKEHFNQDKFCAGRYEYETIEMLAEALENSKSAYDVDKVIEELKERTDFLKNYTKYGNKNTKQQAESYSTMRMYEVADLVDDLIEIVKQGGVSDYVDVCEWKSKKINNEWELSCKPNSTYNVFGVAWFKRCPYCGKKVKVIQNDN